MYGGLKGRRFGIYGFYYFPGTPWIRVAPARSEVAPVIRVPRIPGCIRRYLFIRAPASRAVYTQHCAPLLCRLMFGLISVSLFGLQIRSSSFRSESPLRPVPRTLFPFLPFALSLNKIADEISHLRIWEAVVRSRGARLWKNYTTARRFVCRRM